MLLRLQNRQMKVRFHESLQVLIIVFALYKKKSFVLQKYTFFLWNIK